MLKLLAVVLLIAVLLTPLPVDAARKIILATDVGDDLDDVFALAFALNSPELELDSIIVSGGPTPRRGRLASKMLEAAGRLDIPLIIGRCVIDDYGERRRAQLQWAHNYVYKKPPVTDGWRALSRRIRSSQGKITLVSVGPLTDVADVLKHDPGVKHHIDEIILMGGSISYLLRKADPPTREYNIRADIEASQAVFNSGVPIVMLGLDVTAKMRPTAEQLRQVALSEKPLAKTLHALHQVWGGGIPTFFDPVAVAAAFRPDLVTFEHKCISVTANGVTMIAPDGQPNVHVGVDSNKDRFFELFMARILR